MVSLKTELHAHSGEDTQDKLPYSVYDYIDHAKSLKYEVLAITLHEKVLEGKEFASAAKYAKSKGILLISGCEAKIEGKHVLLYNITDAERKKIKTFADLRVFKKNISKTDREILIVAPHPYFYILGTCLREKLVENIDLFDAIEYHYFYSRILNNNKKAVDIAKKYHKPMIGDCDLHFLDKLGSTYSLINTRKDVNSVIKAIKNGDVQVKTKPISIFSMGMILIRHLLTPKS